MYKKIHMTPMTVQMILKKMNLKFNTKLSPKKTTIMQSQEHWEIGYPFVFYSVKEKGWLCKICTENGEGEYWRTKAVKIRERPNRRFVKHQGSVIQVKAMKKQQSVKGC